MASDKDTGGPAQRADATCHLLKLPPELRNRIYEDIFTTHTKENEDHSIDLLSASGPSKNILLTCKQIHKEAAGMYKLLYKQYWETNTFTLDMRRDEAPVDSTETQEAKRAVRTLPAESINHIRTFHCWTGVGRTESKCKWIYESHRGGKVWLTRYLHWLPTSKPREVVFAPLHFDRSQVRSFRCDWVEDMDMDNALSLRDVLVGFFLEGRR